jgi:predicted HD superfamily hydrolase involved in NAD metabolism
MDVEILKLEIAKRMPQKRFEHVLRVAETATTLAIRYRISKTKAELAALFHDIAKYMDRELLQSIILTEELDNRLLLFHHELWHGPVGAIIARDEFGVSDEDILNAIRYHTTGRAKMSSLEKLIYVSDMIEPGREFPGVATLRRITEENLDSAMGACIQQSVQFLISKGVPVFPDSIDCYNEHANTKGTVEK